MISGGAKKKGEKLRRERRKCGLSYTHYFIPSSRDRGGRKGRMKGRVISPPILFTLSLSGKKKKRKGGGVDSGKRKKGRKKGE